MGGKNKKKTVIKPPRDHHKLARKLGISSEGLPLLKQALTHRSYSHLAGEPSNERLEFLGDSVLSLAITEYLYSKYPRKNEGELSKIRAWLVNAVTLAKVAEELEVGAYILLGTGEEKSGGRKREALLADVMEALIAAVFLNRGWEQVKKFIIRHWGAELKQLLAAGEEPLDPKTRLQELLQRKGESPRYALVRVDGPDHDRSYTVSAYYRDKVVGTGQGKSKKEAEQEAAKEALQYLGKLT
ncbi:MAG TPA: ribonuclease III [Firmicutes bacterium]|jgi:ribonuclease-3|nr:ribonuclease III [Bacillota bacterium]